jgi:hypothetical protein
MWPGAMVVGASNRFTAINIDMDDCSSPHSRFFSKVLLDDHLKKRKEKVKCVEWCVHKMKDVQS